MVVGGCLFVVCAAVRCLLSVCLFNWLLFIVCCLLSVGCCLLMLVHCVANCVLLLVVRCALIVVRWPLSVVCNCNCVMCVVFLLFAVRCWCCVVVD